MDMMAKGKSAVTDENTALDADKVSLDSGSEWLDSLSFDELAELRDRVDAKMIAKKDTEIQELREKAAKLAAVGVRVDIVVGGAGVASRAAKGPSIARVAQTPPEGAKTYVNPDDPSKIWWSGKRGQRPSWLPADAGKE